MQRVAQALRENSIARALETAKELVRESPEDPAPRIALFQIFSLMGDWQRGLQQLQVASKLDAECLGRNIVYRNALRCESFRSEVFAGSRQPHFLGEPEPWMGQLVEALRAEGGGDSAAAVQLRAEALESAPATAGTLHRRESATSREVASVDRFEWFADADSRLGPIVEVVIGEKYLWVPCDRIARIRLEVAKSLEESLWIPAEFVWQNGGEALGLIPVRYAGSDQSEDGAIAQGRATDWRELSDGQYAGLGLRQWSTDTTEVPLLEVAEVVFDAGDAPRT